MTQSVDPAVLLPPPFPDHTQPYVLWREFIAPLIALEFASGNGEEERDRTPLSVSPEGALTKPGKFWVYEQIIRIPSNPMLVQSPVHRLRVPPALYPIGRVRRLLRQSESHLLRHSYGGLHLPKRFQNAAVRCIGFLGSIG
jgi:hypothetical protein